MITEILKNKKLEMLNHSLITHINNNFMSLFNTVIQQPTCDKVNQNKLPCAW